MKAERWANIFFGAGKGMVLPVSMNISGWEPFSTRISHYML